MAGKRKGKVLCGAALEAVRCRQCGKPGNTKAGMTCARCGAALPAYCFRHVWPGEMCPDHPGRAVHPDAPRTVEATAEWRINGGIEGMTEEEAAELAEVQAQPLSSSVRRGAHVVLARGLATGSVETLESAARIAVLAEKLREME